MVGWPHRLTESMNDMNLSKLWEIVKDREVWSAVVHGVAKSRIQLRCQHISQDFLHVRVYYQQAQFTSSFPLKSVPHSILIVPECLQIKECSQNSQCSGLTLTLAGSFWLSFSFVLSVKLLADCSAILLVSASNMELWRIFLTNLH